MNFIELCAGAGGTRAGLEASGWKCIYAADFDPDVVEVHSRVFDEIEMRDVTRLTASEIPRCDAWVVGFPCQPFSSSGTRSGFLHRSGNVFETLMHLVSELHPPVLIFENVVGLLSNKSGHTFASILMMLTSLNYEVDWLVVDASWLGIPQSRPRVFIVASKELALEKPKIEYMQKQLFETDEIRSVFATLIKNLGLKISFNQVGNIASTQQLLNQGIGDPKPSVKGIFTNFGFARGNQFSAYRVKPEKPIVFGKELAEIVAPSFIFPEFIRSARFWSAKGGGGKDGIHIRDTPIAHCVGTTLGGAPLFSVPLSKVEQKAQKKEFLRFADWHREQQDLIVMRLEASRSVRLFGQHTERLEKVIATWDVGATRKFKLIGNMVVPQVASAIAKAVSGAWNGECS